LLKYTKKIKFFALILLTSALLIATISPNIASVKAQTQATVNVVSSVGGTTDPTGSGNLYNDGATVNLAATPDDGYIFLYWTVSTNQYSIQLDTNPAPLIVSGDVTYSVDAVFSSLLPLPDQLMPTDLSNAAFVVVLAGVGGTTSPAPGAYAMANAVSLNLTAIPKTGFTFSHWVIGGTPLSHGGYSFTDTPTNNPYNVNHGYGYTYSYQPVFDAISPSTSPTPKVDEFSTVAAIILAMVLVIVAFGAYTFTKKAKK